METGTHFSIIAFLGAMAIFLYGIKLSRVGVQLLVGNRLKDLISTITQNRITALITGMVTTLILQSSTATTVMLVGFARSGVITLTQAMGVILGADIGTTFVVILFSIKEISEYALLLLVAGIILDFFRSKKATYLGMIFLGFGFVFFGMKLMIHSTMVLKDSHLILEIFSAFISTPATSFFLALLFTAAVQNSATTLGLSIALAFSGLLNLHSALPIVLGANVGTCFSSVLNSIGGGIEARRVALAHLFFKVTGAVIVMLFYPFFLSQLDWMELQFPQLLNNPSTGIAFMHVIFNMGLSVTFLPFIHQGGWLIQKILPESLNKTDRPFSSIYLNENSLSTPALAFANAKREILRMAEIALNMFQETITVFEKNDADLIVNVEVKDDKIDILDREIKFYLAKISQENLSQEQARMQLNLVSITCDLEEICDVINKNILELAAKKISKARHFSAEGWKEIVEMHAKVLENFQLAISIFTTEDKGLAQQMLRHEKHMTFMEDKYRESHLHRLHQGLKETLKTSSIHLDLLSNFHRINAKLTSIVRATFSQNHIHQSIL
ncbi:MAG: Na/Pi cotransporter family protein [Deltaproteobacteria bacterium]|nr:MAG: Na/Pi cotransporter family protein [Deltaproteobacteria bacterium]